MERRRKMVLFSLDSWNPNSTFFFSRKLRISIHKGNHELPLHVHTRTHMWCRCTASRGEARSMESGIIADVDRLKESRRGDPLPYLCNERSPCVSCLRPSTQRPSSLSLFLFFIPTPFNTVVLVSSCDVHPLSFSLLSVPVSLNIPLGLIRSPIVTPFSFES